MASVISGEASDLLTRSTRQQSLIFTIYGAYSRPLEGWLSVSALVDLMNDLGIEEATVRSALSRFKRRGILHAEKRSSLAGYALSYGARQTFDAGDARVLEPRSNQNKGWLLAAFSIPESNRDLRYRLRSRLIWMGFAQVTGGLWIAPAQLENEVLELARELAVTDYLDVFRAEHLAFKPTVEAIAGWWDLKSIASMHQAFIDSQSDVARKWSKGISVTPVAAFVDYTKALTSWRHLPYLDPGLPAEYLPKDWVGMKSADIFFKLKKELASAAMEHVKQTAKR